MDPYGNLKTLLVQEAERDFLLAETLDGSWTVSLPTPDGARAERMHHPAGALTETCQIYGTAIGAMLELTQGSPLRVLSVGLGLGYVELLAAAMFFGRGRADALELVSLESDPFFRDRFGNWLAGGFDSETFPFATLNHIEAITMGVIGLHPKELSLRKYLGDLRREGRFHLLGDIRKLDEDTGRFHLILFDLFSSKTNQELWTEDFIRSFVEARAQGSCIFASYASTGNLKRGLRANGFQLNPLPGFAGKRETTLAHRQLEFDPNQVASRYRPGCY